MKTIFLAEGEKHVLSALHLQIELQTGFEISDESTYLTDQVQVSSCDQQLISPVCRCERGDFLLSLVQ